MGLAPCHSGLQIGDAAVRGLDGSQEGVRSWPVADTRAGREVAAGADALVLPATVVVAPVLQARHLAYQTWGAYPRSLARVLRSSAVDDADKPALVYMNAALDMHQDGRVPPMRSQRGLAATNQSAYPGGWK